MGLRALQRRRHEVSADAAHIALFSSSLEKIILEILESPMNPAIYNNRVLSYIYKIVSADNPVRIDQICESEIKRVLLGTPFSPPTPEAKLAAKEWGPSGVLIAPKNSHSTSTMLRFPESCFFAFFRLFGSRKARAPEGKNGTKI